ncbi:MAG: hypothetical protein NUV67_05265, partial [archaeon]|nr:hypothetical protein [archaeon]
MLFLYILFACSAAILAGLSYMMHREAGLPENQEANFARFLFTGIKIAGVAIIIILFAPKGSLAFL